MHLAVVPARPLWSRSPFPTNGASTHPDTEARDDRHIRRHSADRPKPWLDRLYMRADQAMTRPPDEIIEDFYLRRWHSLRGLCALALRPPLCRERSVRLGARPPLALAVPLPPGNIDRNRGNHPTARRQTFKICRGTVAYRPPHFSHRLDLISGPAVTLFFVGPRLREWGWYLPGGWRPWHEVSGVDEDGVTRMRYPP